MDHCTCESKAALNLIKTARGQMEAVIQMIEADTYCLNVSQQILASISLLKKANITILKQHMNTCVRQAIKEDPETSDKKLQEIIKILESYIA